MRVVVFLGTCSPPAPRPFSSYRCGAPSHRPLQQVLDVCVCVCVMGGSGYLRVEVLSRSLLLLAIFWFSGDLVPLFCRCFSATLALPGFRCSSLDGIQREMAKSAQTKSKDDTFCARTSHETLFSYLYWWLAFVCRVLLFGSSNEKELFVCLCGWVCVCVGGKSEKQKLVENIQQKVKNEENRNEEGNKAQTGQNYLTTLQILHVVFVFLSLYWFYTGERVKRLFVCVCE